MSRIGKLPIAIPEGVTVTISESVVTVKGKKGEMSLNTATPITVSVEGNEVRVHQGGENSKKNRSLHGTTRALINNMIQGVTKGYEKRLEIRGVGYRFTISGKKMNFSLGFSHPVEFPLPEGISVSTDEENKNLIIIQGINKHLVGQTAARIRSLKKPEPYKGKGIRYADEHITIKQGKKAAK